MISDSTFAPDRNYRNARRMFSRSASSKLHRSHQRLREKVSPTTASSATKANNKHKHHAIAYSAYTTDIQREPSREEVDKALKDWFSREDDTPCTVEFIAGVHKYHKKDLIDTLFDDAELVAMLTEVLS